MDDKGNCSLEMQSAGMLDSLKYDLIYFLKRAVATAYLQIPNLPPFSKNRCHCQCRSHHHRHRHKTFGIPLFKHIHHKSGLDVCNNITKRHPAVGPLGLLPPVLDLLPLTSAHVLFAFGGWSKRMPVVITNQLDYHLR